MIFEEKKCCLIDLCSNNCKVGSYAVIPSFTIPAAKVLFDGEEYETPEFVTPETKLYCIQNDGEKIQLLFDNCLFKMTIAPFRENKEISFKSSFLKKYLKKVFVPAFQDQIGLQRTKLKCDIPSYKDVFGDENGENRLQWFEEPKHKIAMYKDESEWWWLSTVYDGDRAVASSATFCNVYYFGNAHCNHASYADLCVRPRFSIGVQA